MLKLLSLILLLSVASGHLGQRRSILQQKAWNFERRNIMRTRESDDDDVRPAPASIGADVPLSYFGPAPSSVQRELIGPYQLLKSGLLDEEAGTITIPLYYGTQVEYRGNTEKCGTEVPNHLIWYVLTDTTDQGIANSLGLNYAAKMKFANVGAGARWGRMGPNNRMQFSESSLVDFSPVLSVVPRNQTADNVNLFPPASAQAGSVGAATYSPIVSVDNLGGTVFNAPVVADYRATIEQLNRYCDGFPAPGTPEYIEARTLVHDKVVAICPREQTVTLSLSPGFSFARPVLYLSTDASGSIGAALEGATHAPGLTDVTVGNDDSFGSAVERLFLVINGFTNAEISPDANVTHHPGRSGLNSALRGEGSPLNVLGGIPTIATDYSPLWDVNMGEWTASAVTNGFRTRWLEEFQILGLVERGFITGPGGAPFGSIGLIVNCPIVSRFL